MILPFPSFLSSLVGDMKDGMRWEKNEEGKCWDRSEDHRPHPTSYLRRHSYTLTTMDQLQNRTAHITINPAHWIMAFRDVICNKCKKDVQVFDQGAILFHLPRAEISWMILLFLHHLCCKSCCLVADECHSARPCLWCSNLPFLSHEAN